MSLAYPQPTVGQLRVGLHALVLALAAVVALRAVVLDERHPWLSTALVAAFGVVYLIRLSTGGPARLVMLIALVGVWAGLLALGADAAYVSVGLFLVFLTELDLVPAVAAIVGVTAVDLAVALARDGGPAGLLAPVLGAVIAGLFGMGFRALFDALGRVAETEHAAGQAAERQRLAREIHDTVAQGLSSIQMLLHAAEAAPTREAAEPHLTLARTTAAASLTEARRLVDELGPADLTDATLAAAIQRVCARSTTDVRMQVDGDPVPLPMPVEAALVRITQGALSNVERHAGPGVSAVVTLAWQPEEVRLDVVDDGVGFDTGVVDDDAVHTFGLDTIRARVAELGGDVSLESEPGHTALSVSFPTHVQASLTTSRPETA